jgi:hypothetical protein
MIFCGMLLPFCKKYLKRNHQKKKIYWKAKNCNNGYNMKGCLRFSTFTFWMSPNFAKHTYGCSLLEHAHKIEKQKNIVFTMHVNILDLYILTHFILFVRCLIPLSPRKC